MNQIVIDDAIQLVFLDGVTSALFLSRTTCASRDTPTVCSLTDFSRTSGMLFVNSRYESRFDSNVGTVVDPVVKILLANSTFVRMFHLFQARKVVDIPPGRGK